MANQRNLPARDIRHTHERPGAGTSRSIPARDIRPGMILARSLEAGVFSVRQVKIVDNKILPYQEVEIYGPLDILIKRRADSPVAILG